MKDWAGGGVVVERNWSVPEERNTSEGLRGNVVSGKAGVPTEAEKLREEKNGKRKRLEKRQRQAYEAQPWGGI